MNRHADFGPRPKRRSGSAAVCVAVSALGVSLTASAGTEVSTFEPARSIAAPANRATVDASDTMTAAANTGYKTLYRFTGGADGEAPFDTVVLDSTTGNLYGTTVAGGANGDGTIFRLSPPAQKGQPWSESVLYNFTGGNDGKQPASFPHLFMDRKGNLYGTATAGGASGQGTVFELAADGTFSTLYSFAGGKDGSKPYSGVIVDENHNFYGTTEYGGGTGCGGAGCGTVWKLAADGTETVLHSFGLRKNDGQEPQDGLLMDRNGNLFGTTLSGGVAGGGTVFEIMSDGSEKVLHSFQGANDGAQPYGYLIEDGAGVLYGTTSGGGINIPAGTVFKLSPQGRNYKESLIYVFQGGQTDGGSPNDVIMDGHGNLYGTAYVGGGTGCGGSGCGSVFKLIPPAKHGKRWTETVLHFFAGSPDGGWPEESVISNGKGILYGTTTSGGEGSCYNGVGCGTVFKIKQ